MARWDGDTFRDVRDKVTVVSKMPTDGEAPHRDKKRRLQPPAAGRAESPPTSTFAHAAPASAPGELEMPLRSNELPTQRNVLPL